MNILFLSRWYPHPADNGSKLRISQLLSGLAQYHRVTLLSFIDDPHAVGDLSSIPGLDRIVDVKVLPWREYQPGSFKATIGLMHPTPRSLLDTFSPDMADLIRKAVAHRQYDLVIASQVSMASYHANFRGIPAILEEVELGVFHDQAGSAPGGIQRLRLNLTWYKMKRYFERLLDSFQAYTVASERERELFTRHFPGHVEQLVTIPNCIDLSSYDGIKAVSVPKRMIFSGSFRYRANYDAMLWFIREVHPRILERIPDAHLIITGDHDGLPLPPARNVELVGYVQDIKSLIATSAVSLAPLRVGGGTRLKIIEAMALGVPVVATSKGAEGLPAENGKDLFIADAPDAYAGCVVGLLEDPDQRNRMAANARRLVADHFNWGTTLPSFLELVEVVAQKRYNFMVG